MEVYERIRQLRKEMLHLSQTEFGERLGVSRSVIKNIELDALVRPDQKEPLYKLICKEFQISYNWLMYGVGEPFAEDPAEDEYTRAAAEIAATDPLAQKLIIDYWRLDKKDKELFWDFMNRFVTKKQEDD